MDGEGVGDGICRRFASAWSNVIDRMVVERVVGERESEEFRWSAAACFGVCISLNAWMCMQREGRGENGGYTCWGSRYKPLVTEIDEGD